MKRWIGFALGLLLLPAIVLVAEASRWVVGVFEAVTSPEMRAYIACAALCLGLGVVGYLWGGAYDYPDSSYTPPPKREDDFGDD